MEVAGSHFGVTGQLLNLTPALINKKQTGSEYLTQFKDNTNKITLNENIANGLNKFFSNALARNIPKCNKNFTHYLNKKVEEKLFLNPVTDDEILALVNNAKSKHSKGHDDIDMCLVKLVIPYILKTHFQQFATKRSLRIA